MKYLSIDIETTGLDPKTADILEVAAVLDDLKHPEVAVEDLPYFRAVIVQERYTTDAYCASLHKALWDEIKSVDNERIKCSGWYLDAGNILKKTHYISPNFLYAIFGDWIFADFSVKRITPAGKNFGSFDLQHLKKLDSRIEQLFSHRCFDPGSLYFKVGDKKIPDLATCLERAGFEKTVKHTALDDARDVIRVLRPKLLKN